MTEQANHITIRPFIDTAFGSAILNKLLCWRGFIKSKSL